MQWLAGLLNNGFGLEFCCSGKGGEMLVWLPFGESHRQFMVSLVVG